MSEPDLTLRARLRALAEHEPLPALSASERVLAERAAEASIRHREPGRGRWAALASSLALAAGTLWLVSSEPGPTRQHAAMLSEAGEAHASRAAATSKLRSPAPGHASTPQPRCEAFARRALGTSLARPGSRLDAARLELGERALFVASQGGVADISLSADCDLHVDLNAGSLFVHARRLEGRTLEVATALGTVVVRGTVFAVHHASGALLVQVDEGTVQVSGPDGHTTMLHAGEAVALGAQAARPRSTSLAARNTMRAALGLARHPRQTPVQAPPASVLTLPEEVIWQLGSVPTPSVPPEPKSSVTDEGRPMKKPRLKQGDGDVR
jgi:hypothetical protein